MERISEIRMVQGTVSNLAVTGLTWTVLATQAIANVVKSSFGPSGLDKMMVDDIGVSLRREYDCETGTDKPRTSQ